MATDVLYRYWSKSVAGAFIIMGCAILSGKLPEVLNRKVHYSMFGLWLLMGLVLLSMIHMGTPMRAFNSFIRLVIHRWQ